MRYQLDKKSVCVINQGIEEQKNKHLAIQASRILKSQTVHELIANIDWINQNCIEK